MNRFSLWLFGAVSALLGVLLLVPPGDVSRLRSLRAEQVVNPNLEVIPAPAAKAVVGKARHHRGHTPPKKEISENRHRVSHAKHKDLLKSLPVMTAATYDARPKGIIPPVGNQAQCGDCYVWSGCKVCSAAQMFAGIAKADSTFMLAPSYFLDCQNVGGCDGGDEYEVAQKIQSSGCPSLAQYGGDGSNPGSCKSTTGMTLYTVHSLVMCSQTQGVAATQDIKNCIGAYGYVSVAVAAGNDWDNYSNGTITGTSTDVNHAVGVVGWDDTHDNGDGSKGAWIMQNNWDTSWGCPCANAANPSTTSGGYAWVKYGADSIGTGAFVAVATAPTPGPAPTPPTPVPPTPAPTPNPTPGPTPVPGNIVAILPDGGTLTIPATYVPFTSAANILDLTGMNAEEVSIMKATYTAIKLLAKSPKPMPMPVGPIKP